MVTYKDPSDLYREGYTEALGECPGEWGLCCSIDDEMVRDLGRSVGKRLTVCARGVGRRVMRILGVQGDVLRARDIDNGAVLLIPLCAVYLFHDADNLPLGEGLPAIIRLDGGGSCRGCNGMVPELLRYIDQQIGVRLPDVEMTLLVTEVVGLTLRGLSGTANVTLRVDCIDALELPDDADSIDINE